MKLFQPNTCPKLVQYKSKGRLSSVIAQLERIAAEVLVQLVVAAAELVYLFLASVVVTDNILYSRGVTCGSFVIFSESHSGFQTKSVVCQSRLVFTGESGIPSWSLAQGGSPASHDSLSD